MAVDQYYRLLVGKVISYIFSLIAHFAYLCAENLILPVKHF